MDKRCLSNGCFDIFKILNTQGKLSSIKLYPISEVVNDPYEKTVSVTFLNPITIKALIQQITQTKLKWKFFGELPSGSIQVITELRHYNSFINSGKIEYENNEYHVYKDSSNQFNILKRSDYIIVVLERKS
jgi:hypothetical protein